MSIVTVDNDWPAYFGSKCTLCEKEVRTPHLEWDYGRLIICGDCCVECKHGLTADLVHLAAIAEVHRLGYSVVRRQTRLLEAENRCPEEERSRHEHVATNLTADGKNLRAIAYRVAEGEWRGNVNSSMWVGKAIGEVLGLDPSTPGERTIIRLVLARLIEIRFLEYRYQGEDPHLHGFFVEVGKRVLNDVGLRNDVRLAKKAGKE